MTDDQTLAQKIRQVFTDLFGSRYMNMLETVNTQLRLDYEQRLNERDETIADLRDQLAQARVKIEGYELVLLPLASPVGKLFAPKREPTFETVIGPTPGSWQDVQAKWYAQQEAEAAKENQPNEIGIREEFQQ
jgi:hypothetical protein